MQGILFKEDMYNAVVNGTKTETRRLLPQKHHEVNNGLFYDFIKYDEDENGAVFKSFADNKTPYHLEHKGEITRCYPPFFGRYKQDEILYLKEPFLFDFYKRPLYKYGEEIIAYAPTGWKNKLFMPATAARQFVRVMTVGVECLKDISEKSAIKEGVKTEQELFTTWYMDYLCEEYIFLDAKRSFLSLWDNINKDHPSTDNPYVFVYKLQLMNGREKEAIQKHLETHPTGRIFSTDIPEIDYPF